MTAGSSSTPELPEFDEWGVPLSPARERTVAERRHIRALEQDRDYYELGTRKRGCGDALRFKNCKHRKSNQNSIFLHQKLHCDLQLVLGWVADILMRVPRRDEHSPQYTERIGTINPWH